MIFVVSVTSRGYIKILYKVMCPLGSMLEILHIAILVTKQFQTNLLTETVVQNDDITTLDSPDLTLAESIEGQKCFWLQSSAINLKLYSSLYKSPPCAYLSGIGN